MSLQMETHVFENPPRKFEGGIQNYAGAIGMGAAVDYLSGLGMKNIESHERELSKELTEGLLSLGVELVGPKVYEKRSSLASFNVKGMEPHDIAVMMNEQNIFLRSGMLCAYPIHKYFHLDRGSVRASLYLYNTKEEVKTFIEKLGSIISTLGG
jgi:cysteine desulfurase/selenocysteine lyase